MRIRIVAPTGRDAELISSTLRQNGIDAQVWHEPHLSVQDMERDDLGPLLIAEEALSPVFIQQLGYFIQHQPAWSDLPILILTTGGRETLQSNRLLHDRLPLGSPVLLERPIRTATLISGVRAALRARQRQYDIRDALRERDAALAQVQTDHETLQVMLDNLPVGVLFAKPSGEITLGNKSFERILRHPLLPTPDVDAHGQWVAFHSDGRRVKGDEYPLPRAMKTGKPIPPEEYLYQRGDRTMGWISLAAAPILNDSGEVTGGVVAISDIDLQKKAEGALLQSAKLAAVGRMASSISHEINNPLEAVTNLLYLAQHACAIPDQTRQLLESADHELRRVSQVVSQTLRFHRQSTSPRAITPKELLGPTLALYKGRLKNSNVDLIEEYRGKDVVTCYESEIRQMLNNLIANAIESMRTGGRLIVRTSDAMLWREQTPGIRISIADTGLGIPQMIKGQIFDAFFTTKGINGTGLGLWISKGIVEKHHGRLEVSSIATTDRSGTVFSLFLPLDPFKKKNEDYNSPLSRQAAKL